MPCEDYPCCGCGPEGCIDFSRKVKCGDCGQSYHPDSQTEKFCYRCQAADRLVWNGDDEGWRNDYE